MQKKRFVNKGKLKICTKCGVLQYHFNRSKICKDCNK